MRPAAPPTPGTTRWWKSPRFWFFALPFVTGGFASWVPPLWVASKVRERQLKAQLFITAVVAAVLALVAGVLLDLAPQDALGNPEGRGANVGFAILLISIVIGTWTAVVHRHRVFPSAADPSDAGDVSADPPLPGVHEAQLRREQRAQYRSLATTDPGLAREMNLGRPDRIPAFDDGGLVDLNVLDAAALERHADVTPDEAASIISTRHKLGRLSSVDELVVHGDLTLETAERLRDYAVFIG